MTPARPLPLFLLSVKTKLTTTVDRYPFASAHGCIRFELVGSRGELGLYSNNLLGPRAGKGNCRRKGIMCVV